MVRTPIYMDNHATTRTDPRVVEAMLPYFTEIYGNAASRTHVFGQQAEEAVSQARAQVAELIGASPREIIFTSGATESNNLALKGAAAAYHSQGNHLITTAIEHRAVLDPALHLQREGWHVTFLPVNRYGLVRPEQVEEAITDRTVLVSVMAANNEIGTLQPIRAIGRLCKERGVPFHTDAAQAGAHVPLDVEEMGIDLLSLSAHKMYGPKGVGALYVRRRHPAVRLEPLFDGGGHERGLRSGTLPVPLVVGFGVACQLCQQERDTEVPRLQYLRDRLQRGIQDQLEDVFLNGPPDQRLPGNLNLAFAHVRGEALLVSLRHVAVSSGSACTSASVEPSHVLRTLGLDDELAHSSLRFGLGRFSTETEVDQVVSAVVEAVRTLRRLNPVHAMLPPERESPTSGGESCVQ